MASDSPRRRLLPFILLVALAVCFGVFSGDQEEQRAEDGLVATEVAGTPEQQRAPGDRDLPASDFSAPQRVEETQETIAEESAVHSAAASALNDIVVEVRDSSGRLLEGVPLALNAAPRRRYMNDPKKDQGALEFTDELGRVTFRNAKDSLPKPSFVSFSVAFKTAPKIELTEALLEQEVIEAVMPPYGSLEVSVFRVDGQPSGRVSSIYIEPIGSEEATNPALVNKRPRFHADYVAGRALFSFVEPGLNWEAVASKSGTDATTSATGEGPMLAGESARLEIHIGSDRPVVKLRLLDADHKAMAETLVHVLSTGGIYGTQTHNDSTDEGGYLWVEVSPEVIEHFPPTLTLTAGESSEALMGKVGPLRDLVFGENDLGDLVLRAQQVLVHGTVVDQSGQPIAGARVGLGTQVNFAYEENMQRYGLSPDTRATSTDGEGAYEFLGLDLPANVRLWATEETESGRTQSEVVQVDAFGSQIHLVLQRAFSPTAEVLLPMGAKANSLASRIQLVVTAANGHTRGPLSSTTMAGPNSTIQYKFEGVLGGHYDVRCSMGETLLMETLDVPVVGNDRLVQYDLRGVLHLHRLHMKNPNPGSERRIKGTYRLFTTVPVWGSEGDGEPSLDGEMEDWESFEFHGNKIEIVSLEPSIDLQVLPTEFRGERIKALSGEHEIVLGAPLTVRLVLVTTGSLPEAPYSFDPTLHLDDVAVGQPVGPRWFSDEKRESVFAIPTPGAIKVKWHLEKRLTAGAIGGEVLYDQNTTIEVLDVPGEQRFEVHLDATVMSAMVNDPPF